MATVRLDRVGKTYANGVVAARDVSFECADGELLVLVGPSGCGKSTTLRMIAGLESITSGDLFIGDTHANDLPPRDRDIAMVFQNYALYPHMTVRANLAFGLKLRRLPKAEIESRVRAAADTLGIASILDRRPSQLSGGQRQRVAVGRAIVREPRVFLFDEPLSNLDARLRAQTRKEIARLHRQLRATMVYVTHDQVEAMTLGERIVVMDGGVVQQIDAPLVVYSRPLNRFVAGFIGNPAMNLIEGQVIRDDGRHFLSADARLRINLDGQSLSVPERIPLTLGIRPEHLTVTDESDSRETIRLQLDLVEPMGNEIIVYGTAGSTEIVARLSPCPLPEPGSPLHVSLDPGNFHFFDGATGRSLH